MAKKLSKQELKTPDVFLSTSEQIYRILERNMRPLIAVVVFVIVGLIGYATNRFINNRREKAAVEALYPAESALQAAQDKVRQERADIMKKEMADKGNKDVKVEDARPVDYAKDFAPAVGQMEAAIQAHANTRAAMISAMNLSYFLIRQKQYPKALEVLNAVQYQPTSGDLLQGFWLMHRGLSLVENKQFDQAISTYGQVLNIPNLKSFFPNAILKLGLCYQLKGQMDKARSTYERLTREYPATEASNSAREYLRLLNLNLKAG